MCKVGELCGCGYKNTGMKYGHVWDAINNLIDKEVGCEQCNIHGHFNVNGLRENIAVGIGKMPHDAKLYEKWVSEVNCVYQNYLKRKNQFQGFK